MTDIQIISGGNFSHQPLARSRDEIGIVSRLLGDMALGLKAAQDVWTENQSRKHDLDIAKEIQENLLPKHVPRIAGYDVSAYYSPSKEVGGDYYDFFLVDKTHLGMICADVSGKGIPGSMVMMMCKALISYEASENLSPRDIFCKVNRTLAKDIKRGMFVTAFYMLLDIPTARLTVASAGHNPLLLYRAATRQCTQINPGGIALGFDKDGRLFERNMKEEVIQLQRGDRAVIFTDGVTEAMSPTNEEFGEERLMAITVQCAGKTSSEYLTQMVNAIQSHAQADEQHDDITVVTLKVG
jgi:sigma-B regulation protein RsbU (phosphoserine phosphatase)